MGKWDAGFQKPPRFYVHRNYALFAMLADVRNKPPGNLYYITPISEPRGVPEDANKRALATHIRALTEKSLQPASVMPIRGAA